MKIIPTPQYADYKLSDLDKAPKDRALLVYADENLKKSAEKAFAFLNDFEFSDFEKATLFVTTKKEVAEIFFVPDYNWFENKNAKEQGYIIKGFSDGKILIYAEETVGIMYALATFIQIPSVLNEFEIKDFPDFKYRGNNWLLWAETEVWSFDMGDGIDALKERVIRKLDLCLKYKINMVYFDAWGFDTERYPDYVPLMNYFNREARQRNIYLVFGGYTMGYGMCNHQFGKHLSKVYQNKTSYPDGEVYDCLGTFTRYKDETGETITSIIARSFGTCLSNEKLMDLKLEEIRNFIKKVCPGGLYLHNMDSYLIDEALWNSRCENCRKKWPNDDLFAIDGMAGAFAYFFDKLNSGLKDIIVDDYNSSEDMLIFNVSPGYMWYHINDDMVEKASKFWKAVRNYSKVKENVFPTFRELYYNRNDNKCRIPDIIGKNGENIENFAIVNFNGSDGFYSDKLFFTGSVFNYMFESADVILGCNGNYFQEPMQIFNSEYMWNSENSAFYNLKDRPIGYDAFLELYFDAQKTKVRPDEIYGKNGFLDIICQKLYGAEWEKIAEYFKLCGENFECPTPYVCNKELGMAGNDVYLKYRWENELTKDEIKAYISTFSETKRLNELSISLLKGLENPDIQSYCSMLEASSPFVSLWLEYLKLYDKINSAFTEKTEFNMVSELEELYKKADDLLKTYYNSGIETVDIMKGAFSRYEELLVTLKENLAMMKKSIEENKRIPSNENATDGKEIWW